MLPLDAASFREATSGISPRQCWSFGRSSVGGKTVQQAVAAGGLEIRLRAAALGAARGMRGVPRLRSIVVAQALAVDVAEHCRSLRRTRPVLAGAVLTGSERGAIGLRSRQRVVAVRRIAAAVDDFAFFGKRGLLGEV